VTALDIVGHFVQSALMSEAASAARFGVAMKVLGATFYWVSGFATVIAFIANRQYRYDPLLKYGLPAIIAVVGLVAGSLIRAAGYALKLMAERSAPARLDDALIDA
jgi:hypothetical protein